MVYFGSVSGSLTWKRLWTSVLKYLRILHDAAPAADCVDQQVKLPVNTCIMNLFNLTEINTALLSLHQILLIQDFYVHHTVQVKGALCEKWPETEDRMWTEVCLMWWGCEASLKRDCCVVSDSRSWAVTWQQRSPDCVLWPSRTSCCSVRGWMCMKWR